MTWTLVIALLWGLAGWALRRKRALAAACLTAALLTLVPPLVSYSKNRALVRGVRATLTALRQEDRGELARLEDLSTLEAWIQQLAKYQKQGAPFWMRFGMYQGDTLLPGARSAYDDALRPVVLGGLHQRLEQELDAFSRGPGSPDWKPGTEDYARHFDMLKLYLLTTWPHAPGEPPLDNVHQAWLLDQVEQHWSNLKGSDGEAPSQQALTRHARAYVRMLAADPARFSFPRDPQLVTAVRQALDAVPRVALELERLIADAGRESPDLTLDGIAGTVPGMLATGRVRGAFTRAAWEQVVRSRLESAFGNREAWVLDRDAGEDEARARAELRTRYFQLYIQEWRGFLESITVQPPNGVDPMLALLASLTRDKPPAFVRLFQAVVSNVQLEHAPDAPGPDAVTCAYPLEPRDVEAAFAPLVAFTTEAPRSKNGEEHEETDGEAEPTALDFYQDQLALALDDLQGVKNKPTEPGDLLEELRATRERVAQLVKKYESAGPLLEKLLLPPLQDVRATVFARVARTQDNDWCEAISRPFRQLMANRYPFVRESLQDASLDELARFLRPSDGTLHQFVQRNLGNAVTQSGRTWAFATVNARELYRDELLAFLEKSSNLATALFPGDTEEPLVRFQVRLRAGTSPDTPPSALSSITLTLDGTSVTYRDEPDNPWKLLLWPGQGGRPGVHLHVENASGASADLDEPGPWGLFRLLERARRIEPSADGRYFTAVWDPEELNGALVAIDFRPERTANPFLGPSGTGPSRLLRVFREPGLMPPNGIARDGRGCAEGVSSKVSSNDAP